MHYYLANNIIVVYSEIHELYGSALPDTLLGLL